jgi:hypothetical protein
MTLAADIASDLAGFDGVETVSHFCQSTNTTDSAVTGLQRTTLQAAGGEIEPRDTVWHLQANTVTTAPVPGDSITDGDGVVYTITGVSTQVMETIYRCQCTEQVS